MSFVRGISPLTRIASLLVVALLGLLIRRRGFSWVVAVALASGTGIALFQLVPATNLGPWASRQAQHPVLVSTSGQTAIYGFRELAEGERVRYGVRPLDLDAVERLWFGLEAFASWEGVAHTWLTFGFRDGSKITVSVESRRAEGEPFSALRGLFKAYELIYVIGDQEELIGKRVKDAEGSVFIYPVRANKARIRQLLTSILERSAELSDAPEHYNTLTNNCTTNLARHVHAIAPQTLPWFDSRILFPGFSDQLLHQLQLIDTDLPYEEARERFRVKQPGADTVVSVNSRVLLDHPIIGERYFFPRPASPQTPWIVNTGGVALRGAKIPARGQASRGLLFFHGNGEVAAEWEPALAPLTAEGFDVFVSEYRGYGGSSGTPKLASMLDDALAAADATGIEPQRLFVYGRSVGSLYALHVAVHRPVAGLILESAIADVAERIDLRVDAAELGVERARLHSALAEHLDQLTKLEAAKCPSLILHAERDQLVAARHARQLDVAAGPRGTLHLFATGDHNTLHAHHGSEILRRVVAFADQVESD